MNLIFLALETTGIRRMFQTVVSSKSFASKNQAVKKIIGSTICDNVIMVGDRQYDFISAKENCISSIAMQYGYGSADEISMATFIAKTPEDICPMAMQLTLYSQIYSKIKQTPGVRCVGVNGVDTSGKSTFAVQFASFLRSKGEKASVICLDDFHNPKALRLTGTNEIDAYITNAFDLKTVANELLCPIRNNEEVFKELTLLDLSSDTYTQKCRYEIEKDSIVILEGVLLYRKPIEDYIDFKIFLDISFDEVIRRATVRDVPKYGIEFLDRYRDKYIPIQKWYLGSCKPKEKSHVIVDNSDNDHPFIV